MQFRSLVVALALVFSAPVAASAQDADRWAGAYGGLTYSTGRAHQLYFSVVPYELEGNGPGAMLGYNHATGPWVLGGELAYSAARIGEAAPYTYITFTSFLDLKARAGYAMNKALFYGTIGESFTQWQASVGNGGYDGNGFLYGIGVDYLATPRVFVGAEYLVRNIGSEWNSVGGTFDADVETLTLRAGMKF